MPFNLLVLNQTQYCIDNCFDLLKIEIGKSMGLDLRLMLFLLFLVIGGAVLNYLIFYKKKIDDPNVQKIIRVYIILSFYLSIIFLLMSIKLIMGLPSLF